LLPVVRTRGELSDLMWEMLGELGTSHAYEIGGDHRRPPQYRRGFLGADLAWNDGLHGYEIKKIYRGDSWNREIDSPLAEPGLDLRVGDAILAIGGRAVTKELSPDELLVNAADREVQLTVASGKRKRRVIVRALRDERMLRYRAWVEDNRTYVHERTAGRVGYVHIPDMGPWGFSEFHRGYLSEFNRDALIVDVRYNRGGHVSPLLLEKLARKRVGYDVSRWGPPVPYPPESVGGPMVALTNQFAGSDGDIFSHCFKLYKLGPLVGKRTWGGVIGINPYHRLVDGTITTQPEFSFWFADVGWKVENYGTDPDYDVDIAPQDVKAGLDPQMTKALDLVAQAHAAAPNGKPHFETRPNLGLPRELTAR
jgi:tricorn protease